MSASSLKLFARVAASSLERDSARLARRGGYSGVEMLYSDFGASRGQLPFAAVRSLLEAHQLRLIVRLSTQCGSTDPAAHVAALEQRLLELDAGLGDAVTQVVAEVRCRRWVLDEGAAYLRGVAPVVAAFGRPVAHATSRHDWGTAVGIGEAVEALASRDVAPRLSLDPAPLLGGPTEDGAEGRALRRCGDLVDHLTLSPGWSPYPEGSWRAVDGAFAEAKQRGAGSGGGGSVRGAHEFLVSLPVAVALDAREAHGGAGMHGFEARVRALWDGTAAVGAASASPDETRATAIAPQQPFPWSAGAVGTAPHSSSLSFSSDATPAVTPTATPQPASPVKAPAKAPAAAATADGLEAVAARLERLLAARAAAATVAAESAERESSEVSAVLRELLGEVREAKRRSLTLEAQVDALSARLARLEEHDPQPTTTAANARQPIGGEHLHSFINGPFT